MGKILIIIIVPVIKGWKPWNLQTKLVYILCVLIMILFKEVGGKCIRIYVVKMVA